MLRLKMSHNEHGLMLRETDYDYDGDGLPFDRNDNVVLKFLDEDEFERVNKMLFTVRKNLFLEGYAVSPNGIDFYAVDTTTAIPINIWKSKTYAGLTSTDYVYRRGKRVEFDSLESAWDWFSKNILRSRANTRRKIKNLKASQNEQ